VRKIAIIPARGGSKRVLNKNLKLINNKPLFSYSVNAAMESELFDDVYINSDDEAILSKCKEFGAVPYRRPLTYGGDKVFVIDVIKEMLLQIGAEEDWTVGILLPTSPLITPDDIKGAYQLYRQHESSVPVVSVTEYETPIHLAQNLINGRLEPVFKSEYAKSTRSTDHGVIYKYNEAIIFNSVKRLMKQSNLIGGSSLPYVMPPERSIMIDYNYQFDMAKMIIERGSNETC